MASVTVNVHVSGKCPNCGITNNAQIPTQVPDRGKVAGATAEASCGACGATVFRCDGCPDWIP